MFKNYVYVSNPAEDYSQDAIFPGLGMFHVLHGSRIWQLYTFSYGDI